jgi:group II intron reverse transcriptase/maturase
VAPERALISLHHYIDVHWLAEAYRRTRKDGAVGTDGVTAEEYERDLLGNLRSLLERFKSGQYRAPAVRRAWVPKRTGRELRPIGIPTFDDKVLQRAVAMVLEAVYEEDFLDCSYGFRPGRSAHQALQAVRDSLMEMQGGWMLEVDIRSFFEELDATHLRAFLDRRVRDGVLRRAIDKWLKAGVLEGEQMLHRERGTPQGGVISPLLANIYLHEVVDRWFMAEVRPRLRGRSFLVRYADDMVMGFEHESDALRVQEALHRRCARYGLRLHPEKTRVVAMRRPPYRGTPTRDERPGSFDFLGFTHVWVRSRQGNWVIRQQTAKDRVSRVIQRCGEWCRRHRHEPVGWQHRQLSRAYRGYLAYFGITGNMRALDRVRVGVERVWHKWLARRSQRGMTWQRFQAIKRRFALPPATIVHRYSHA